MFTCRYLCLSYVVLGARSCGGKVLYHFICNCAVYVGSISRYPYRQVHYHGLLGEGYVQEGLVHMVGFVGCVVAFVGGAISKPGENHTAVTGVKGHDLILLTRKYGKGYK
ncbi:hypothetical protein SDC9_199889 [bioreactor metagenome]|uniref:Uncharacterized protein n=1 Tax=bioreactor metagenome TaxID=1076179 RepID=A0A645IYD5_9ZZZZ